MSESSPNWGGQQYRLVREAKWLVKNGHEVLVVCGRKSRLAEQLEKQASEVPVKHLRTWGGIGGFLSLVRTAYEWKPDIIHTRSGEDSTAGCFLHLLGWKVVRSRHMTIPPYLTTRRKFAYRSGCSRIIATAEFIKRDLQVLGGVSEDFVDVVGEGVDLKEFRPGLDGTAFRKEFGIPAEAPLFGMVAMVRGEKGHRHFITAAVEVLRSMPDARFVIVGDGQESSMKKLRNKVNQLFKGQSKPPVIFTGYREDIPAIMAALDVVVVPSLQDAQTLVIPQAFASGKPVIASLVGGIPELVKHDRNGLLVRPGDEKGLAASMIFLGGTPQLRDTLGRGGLEYARHELAFDDKMELIVASYRRTLDTFIPRAKRQPIPLGQRPHEILHA